MSDSPIQLTRRSFMGAMGAPALGAAAAACAPAAAPIQPQESTGAAWEKEWQELAAAAKKEGAVSVLSLVGAGYTKTVDAFSQAFPGIEGQHQGFAGVTIYEPKIRQERQAGIYSFDVALVPMSVDQFSMRNDGIFDDTKPVIFRPDVLDDKAWHYGFEWGWVDEKKVWGYSSTYELRRAIGINTNLVKETEIKSVKDLLDPKWKGKMMFGDVRQGGMFLAMTSFRKVIGDEGIKKLIIDQEPVHSLDTRQILEALIRGRFGIVLPGLTPWPVLKDLRDEGLNQSHIKWLELPEATYVISVAALLLNKAPHPNAAKLFINWILTKEGQTVLSKNVDFNSRRTDVPVVDQETMVKPGAVPDAYVRMNYYTNYPAILETQKLLQDLVRQRG